MTLQEDLNNQAGLIYLLLLGRERTGKELFEEIQDMELIKDASPRIYAIFSNLEKKGHIKTIRESGKEKFRTSSIEPLKTFYELKNREFNENEIIMLKITSKFLKYFSRYIEFFVTQFNLSWVKIDYNTLFTKYLEFQQLLMTIGLEDFLISKKSFGNMDYDIIRMAANIFNANMVIIEDQIKIRDQINLEMSDEDKKFLAKYYFENMLSTRVPGALGKKILELYHKSIT